jgi:hypothetical protein
MFNKIRSGELSKDAFESQLAQYEKEKIVIRRNASDLSPEFVKEKLRDLDLSISFTQIFIDKFDEIVNP